VFIFGLSYLPAFEVAPKVGKGGREPVIDTMEGQLLVCYFHDRLKSRHGVRRELITRHGVRRRLITRHGDRGIGRGTWNNWSWGDGGIRIS
jgi:hypothetical protein